MLSFIFAQCYIYRSWCVLVFSGIIYIEIINKSKWKQFSKFIGVPQDIIFNCMKLDYLLDYVYEKDSCGRPKLKISWKTVLDSLEISDIRENEAVDNILDFLWTKMSDELKTKWTNN